MHTVNLETTAVLARRCERLARVAAERGGRLGLVEPALRAAAGYADARELPPEAVAARWRAVLDEPRATVWREASEEE